MTFLIILMLPWNIAVQLSSVLGHTKQCAAAALWAPRSLFKMQNPNLGDTRDTLQLRSGLHSSSSQVNLVRRCILPSAPSIHRGSVIVGWVSCYICLNSRDIGPQSWMDLFTASLREPSERPARSSFFLCVSKQLRTTSVVQSRSVMKKGK